MSESGISYQTTQNPASASGILLALGGLANSVQTPRHLGNATRKCYGLFNSVNMSESSSYPTTRYNYLEAVFV
jgi:hypothetical protein